MRVNIFIKKNTFSQKKTKTKKLPQNNNKKHTQTKTPSYDVPKQAPNTDCRKSMLNCWRVESEQSTLALLSYIQWAQETVCLPSCPDTTTSQGVRHFPQKGIYRSHRFARGNSSFGHEETEEGSQCKSPKMALTGKVSALPSVSK